MRRPALWLFAILLCACSAEPPALPRLGANDVILAFGDSLTYGTGASEERSYPAVLQQLIQRSVVRAGVPGETTRQGLTRLPAALDEHAPKLVLLCLGGNDMLQKVTPATIRSNLRAMIELIRQRKMNVVLIGVPEPKLFSDPPTLYEELAAEFALPYEGEVFDKVLHDNALKSDAIHPNAAGYKRVAEVLAELLRKSGAI
jgi:lysophospholipase L1-like esterase